MNAIVHNQIQSAILPYEEDMAMRAAYLFANMLLTSGGSDSIAHYMANFPEDAPVRRQLILLQSNPFPAPGWRKIAASAPEMRKVILKWDNTKHPTKPILVAKKKLLDNIRTNYLVVRNHIIKAYPSRALLLLGDLLTKENYGSFESSPEDPELQNDTFVSFSGIFQTILDKRSLEEGRLFLLTDNFFTSKAAAGLARYERLEDVSGGGPCLVSLFRFPDLNLFTSEELHALRQSLDGLVREFAGAVRSWTAGFAEKAANGAEQQEKQAQLVAHARELGHALQEHMLVQRAAKDREVELVMGVLPAALIWQYFREVGTVPDKTWEVLSAVPGSERLCPVMALRYVRRANFYVPDEDDERLIPTQKKSLLID